MQPAQETAINQPVETMGREDMRTGRETNVFRARIISTLEKNGLREAPLVRMLDHTIKMFKSHGMGRKYYGYHNIFHDLGVAYVMLLSACSDKRPEGITDHDIKHLYVAALLHDFDPHKSVDKPHEETVLDAISKDSKITAMLKDADISLPLVKAFILSTTYPWEGENRRRAMKQIDGYLADSDAVRNDPALREHYSRLGRCLSVVDRVAGYALGDFAHSMELAKMNAHALAWKPSLIVRRSVAYFESLMNTETDVFHAVIRSLSPELRKNFFDAVLGFMRLRTREISVRADFKYGNQRFRVSMDAMDIRKDPGFATALRSIFDELPRPLQFRPDSFEDSITDAEVILNTLRISNGQIIGFAKGGPLEFYDLGKHIHDTNLGRYNTIFLEPLALKSGYWGLGGGSSMRHHFVIQASANGYEYLTSFALRDVIESRVGREPIKFVKKVDPARWDYYRLRLPAVRHI